MARTTSRSCTRAVNHDERDTTVAVFVGCMDARAVLWMFVQIQDRPLESLQCMSVEQMQISMKFQAEINVDEWMRKTNDFLNSEAKGINWNGYNMFGAGVASPETPARGAVALPSAEVLGHLALPSELASKMGQDVTADPHHPQGHQ